MMIICWFQASECSVLQTERLWFILEITGGKWEHDT